MNHKIEENKLIIQMPERVNETNAMQLKEDIVALITRYPDYPLYFDCASLKAISSSGLRALLIAQKKKTGEKIVLKNVHREVNEILEMTGFDEIFHVSKSLRRCPIEGCKKIASCTNGALYSLKNNIMVKAFHSDYSLEDVENELTLTQKALACGIPTPISFVTVHCENGYGILFEQLSATSLAQLLARDPKKSTDYARKLALFCRELHQTEIRPDALPDIKQRYRGWLDKTKGRLPQESWNQLKAMVEQMADADTFVHGDLSLNSVFLVDDELMLIDMGSCGFGHAIFDLQSLYASLVAIEIDRPGYCMETMGLDAKFCRGFWSEFMHFYLQEDSTDTGTPIYVDDNFFKKKKRMNQLLTQYYILKEMLLDELHTS